MYVSAVNADSADRSSGRPTAGLGRPSLSIATIASPSIALDILLTVGIAVLIASPSLFTHQPFMSDYGNSYWLGWVESHSLAHTFAPTYFLQTDGNDGVFNPLFAYYGGPLWTIFGVANLATLGHYGIAFACVIALAAASAYGGSLWLARQCGVPGFWAHFVALVFPTSAYYVTNVYGRGDIAEFVATSSIPLAIASAAHLLRARRWTPLPVIAFLSSVVVLTGSHNITLLWGMVVAIIMAAGLLALLRPAWPSATRVAGVAGLGCIAVGVNAWYLVPDLLYSSNTNVAITLAKTDGWGAPFLNTPQLLFNPLRALSTTAAESTPALYVQLPIWFLAWACCAALIVFARSPWSRLRRTWGVLAALLVSLLIVTLSPLAWNSLPAALKYAQFPYRVGAYVDMVIAGLVMIGSIAVAATRSKAAIALRVGAVIVAAVSVALCTWQLWVPRTEPSRPPAYYADINEALASVNTLPVKTWYERMNYVDVTAPLREVAAGRFVAISPRLIHSDRFTGAVDLPPGLAPILTNIAGSPLVRIEGVRRVGRDPYGFVVVERKAPGSGPVHIVVEETPNVPLRLAWWLTVASLVGCVAIVILVTARARVTSKSDAHDRRRVATMSR